MNRTLKRLPIYGWRNLSGHMQCCDETLKTMIRIRGFPGPVKSRRGKTLINTWYTDDIERWLAANKLPGRE